MEEDELFEERSRATLIRLDRDQELHGEAVVRFDLSQHAKGDPAVTIDFHLAQADLVTALDIVTSWAPCGLAIDRHKFHHLAVKGLHMQRPGEPGQVLRLLCGGLEIALSLSGSSSHRDESANGMDRPCS